MKQKDTKYNPLAGVRIIGLSDEGADPHRQMDNLPAGNLFIFRHYKVAARNNLAWRLAKKAKAHGLLFFVASDRRLAWQLGNLCDGVHFPEWQVAQMGQAAQTAHRPHWLCSAAAHSLPALFRAARHQMDFALVSPIFSPHTKKSTRTPLGVLTFARLTTRSPLPIVPLGGLNLTRGKRLGVKTIALVSALDK